MRLIPDDVPSAITPSGQFVVWDKYTIDLTDAEWDEIFGRFVTDEVVMGAYVGAGNKVQFHTRGGITFAQYLRELIELKRANDGR